VVVDVQDSFVLREAGRRETVAGGQVLDVEPPARPGPDPARRLHARVDADRGTLAWRTVVDRGVVRVADVRVLIGASVEEAERRGAVRLGPWVAGPEVLDDVTRRLLGALSDHHAGRPLSEGMDLAEVRLLLAARHPAFADHGLADALVAHLAGAGRLARSATTVRLPEHRATTKGREDADLLVAAVAGAEPSPPTVKELAGAGFGPELIRAACADGRLVRISPDLVVTPGLLARAEQAVRALGAGSGVTVSAFREALGTSRKYALPILEHFDAKGLTRRQGDVRVLRG